MKTPSSRPKLSRQDIERVLSAKKVLLKKHPVILVGIRGYYEDTFGKPGQNDRGFYDDAAFWITKDSFLSFNYNTDPSRFREGVGVGSQKGMAVLKLGVWMYQRGPHKGYAAFRQAQAVTVQRDKRGGGSYEDTGWFGINIHRGGVGTTSSEGCQTLPVSQWVEFKTHGYNELTKKNVEVFPYILITNDELNKILGQSQSVINEPLPPTPPETPSVSHSFKRGDTGEGVKNIQSLVNDFRSYLSLEPLLEDGDFGIKTESAIKHFQNIMALKVDGIVGPKTLRALQMTPTPSIERLEPLDAD
jgi:lysozyme